MNIGQVDNFRLNSWRIEPTSGKLDREGVEKFLRPKEMRLLVFLVMNRNRVVPIDELILHVWEGAVVSNDSLYFSVSQLRSTLDDQDGSPSVIKTISKRGYRLVGDVELPTPLDTEQEVPSDGLRRTTAKTSRFKSGRWFSRPTFAILTIFALALSAIGVGLLRQTSGESVSTSPVHEANSIAILPFIDLTEGGNHAYLSDGIAEEILNRLMLTQGLRVAARTSSFSFRSSEPDIVRIGQALNVATIVDGSVRKEGNRIRISVQLIDARNGFQLWAKSYDREFSDVFAVQSDISRHIVDSLQTTLQIQLDYRANLPDQHVDPLALEEYLLGKESLRINTFDSLRRAVEHFEIAIRLDPEFHNAGVQLADAKLAQLRTGASTDVRLAYEAETLVLDALQKNPNDASSHRVLATAYRFQRRPQDRAQALNIALELAPGDSQVLLQLAEQDFALGRIQDAIQLLQRANRINPFGEHTSTLMGIAQSRLGQVETAITTIDNAIGLNPESSNLHWLKGLFQIQDRGQIATGLSSLLRSARIDRHDYEMAAYVAATYSSLEMPELAKVWVERANRNGVDTPTSNAAEAIHLWVTGREERAGEIAITELHNRSKRFGSHGMLTRSVLTIAANFLVQEGRTGDAISMLEQLSPFGDEGFLRDSDDAQLLARVGTMIMPRRWLITLAGAYKTDGRTKELAQTLQRMQIARIGSVNEYRERLRNDDYLFEAEVRTLEGDIDGALDMLEIAVASNLLFNWQIEVEQNFVLADLRSEPRYSTLLEEIQSKIRRQRDLAIELGQPDTWTAKQLD